TKASPRPCSSSQLTSDRRGGSQEPSLTRQRTEGTRSRVRRSGPQACRTALHTSSLTSSSAVGTRSHRSHWGSTSRIAALAKAHAVGDQGSAHGPPTNGSTQSVARGTPGATGRKEH